MEKVSLLLPVEIKFERLADIPKSETVSTLYYGGSGVGKTFFLGTAGDRSLLIDCGVGPLDTLKSLTFKEKVGSSPIVVRLREKLDSNGVPLGKAFDELCRIIDYSLENLSDDFDNVLIDNATAIRRFAMIRGLSISKDLGRSKTKDTVLASYKMVIPAIQDYGMEMSMIEWFITTYIDILKAEGKNFILTAHQRLTYLKGDRIGDAPVLEKIRPGFTGQTFPDDVPALFDEVWYAERVGSGAGAVFRCKTQGDEQIIAKTSHGAGTLAVIEQDPNFLKMLERMRSGAVKPPIKRG